MTGTCPRCGREVGPTDWWVTRITTDGEWIDVCEDCDRDLPDGLLDESIGREIVTDGGQSAGVTEHGLRQRGWWYDADWIDCPRCRGTGENVECMDDLCHAQGRCMHGDNLCILCEGEGRITRELESRWYGREGFDPVTIPDADLHARRKLHAVARERYTDTDTDHDEGGGRP